MILCNAALTTGQCVALWYAGVALPVQHPCTSSAQLRQHPILYTAHVVPQFGPLLPLLLPSSVSVLSFTVVVRPQVMETLQAPSRGLVGALTALFSPKFLLSKDTRVDVLQWIAAALRCDTERAKMHPTDAKATSDGFMYNLNRVLLHLCGPFTDFYSGKAKQFINLECAVPHAACPQLNASVTYSTRMKNAARYACASLRRDSFRKS